MRSPCRRQARAAFHHEEPALSTDPARSDGARDPVEAERAFTELGRLLVDQPLGLFLRHVTELAPRALPGVDEISVTLVEDGLATSAAFSSSSAAVLDERQYEAGFGPSLDAAASGETIRIDVVAGDDRYPAFVSVARRQGLAGTVAVGIPVPVPTVGAALNLYTRTDALSEETVALAQTFAAYAAVALANAHLYGAAIRRAEQFQEMAEQFQEQWPPAPSSSRPRAS